MGQFKYFPIKHLYLLHVLDTFYTPSRQKAKAGKSSEMDMMSDLDNSDVMLGNGSDSPIERELASAIEQSSVQGDIEDELQQRNDYRNFSLENDQLRQNDVRQSFETFSIEFNLRLSQEMDLLMSMVHNQINRAISTAISERVIPEIQNIVSSMSSSRNRDRKPVCRQIVRKTGDVHPGLNLNLQKGTHGPRVI